MSRKVNFLFVVLAVLLSVFLSARQTEARATAAGVRETQWDRSAVDDCFGVPPRELAACRQASQQLAELRRIRLDDCYDVGIGELAACRRESQQRAELQCIRRDDCYDLGIAGLAVCRRANHLAVWQYRPRLDE